MSYKLGSLFDGSGGFPLSGALCGVEPVWAAEVEPYPIAVTRSRFPNMKHLGDISKINGGEIEPVDIITFGSPCQDLSVAGKRAGLKHEANGDEETTRSGLFIEAVRIIKEMREATGGQFPRFALWENVTGAFSSNKGEDFRVVCEELIKIVEPSASMPLVPKGGWSYADSYVGDGWSLAYRVFDAQYWGVPQRRRRIHLVADFSGQCAREVLFEREGVRGYFTEGRTPWQATPADAQGSPGADDREGATAGGRQLDAVAYGISSYQSNAMLSDNPHSGIYVAQTSRTLDLNGGSPACNQGGIAIVEPIPLPPHATGFDPQAARVVYQDRVAALCGTDYKCVQQQQVEQDKLIVEETPPPVRYIVRRLTPTECARLQGFADWWSFVEKKDSLTDEEYQFWLEVRNTHAAINGKKVQDYTEKQMLTWYNKLYTDSAEYKMWGNGIALPPALYCLQGIVDVLSRGSGKTTEEAEPTDLSDAPSEIKEEILANADKLEAKKMEVATSPKTLKVRPIAKRKVVAAVIKRDAKHRVTKQRRTHRHGHCNH